MTARGSRFMIKRDPRADAGWLVIEFPTQVVLWPARAVAVFADWSDAIRWAQDRANPGRDARQRLTIGWRTTSDPWPEEEPPMTDQPVPGYVIDLTRPIEIHQGDTDD